MNGRVDEDARALITVAVQPSENAPMCELEVWVDTGFNGDLALPQSRIDELGFQQAGTIMGILADGSEIVLDRYLGWIDWLGGSFDVEVIAHGGEYPLLGIRLLADHDLHISYRSGEISIV